MHYTGTKEQCDLYNNYVSMEMGLTNNDDKWSNPQELTNGNWAVFAHPSFPSYVMQTVEAPEFKI